jgi:hypothetical protein
MNNYRKYFIRSIRVNYPTNYKDIIHLVDTHYSVISKDTKFALTSKNPLDKRLDFCAYFLGLIKALEVKGETFENIRNICLEIATEYVRPKNLLQASLKRLIPKLANTWLARYVYKSLNKRVAHNENPNGFVAQVVTGKQETNGFGFGIDILECGICKLFQKHNYHKYSSILCEVDKITSGQAGLKLLRTGTIANGATKCDFRFIIDTK